MIHGKVFPATAIGFADLISACNVAALKGKRLVTVVQLSDKALGAIFTDSEPKTGDSFFEEGL